MIPLTITTNLDIDPWTDLLGIRNTPTFAGGGQIERIGVLPNGTQQERACVEFMIRLDDGRVVVAETTLRLFQAASHAVLASPVAQMEDL